MGRRELESNLPLPGLIAKRTEARPASQTRQRKGHTLSLYYLLNLGASGRILRMRGQETQPSKDSTGS